MNCEKAKELLSLYIDGILDENERTLLEKHLKQCPDCMEEHDKLVAAINALNKLEELEPPDTLKGSIMKKVKQQPPKATFFIKRNWIAWGATAAVIVIMVTTVAVSNFFELSGTNDLAKENSADTGFMVMDMPQPEMERASEPDNGEVGALGIMDGYSDGSLSAEENGVYSLQEYSLELTGNDKEKIAEEVSLLLNDVASYKINDDIVIIGWLEEYNQETMNTIKELGTLSREYVLEKDMLLASKDLEIEKDNLLREMKEAEDYSDQAIRVDLETNLWQLEMLKELQLKNIVFYEIYIR